MLHISVLCSQLCRHSYTKQLLQHHHQCAKGQRQGQIFECLVRISQPQNNKAISSTPPSLQRVSSFCRTCARRCSIRAICSGLLSGKQGVYICTCERKLRISRERRWTHLEISLIDHTVKMFFHPYRSHCLFNHQRFGETAIYQKFIDNCLCL